jgi:tetratricopeptide (TPR) repeat protein
VLRLLVVLCVVQGAARADEADVELARQRYKTGQALFDRGRVADALHEFEDGKASFALPEFDYNIGLCLAKLGRPTEAADALARYIEARPDDPDAAGIWKMIAELRAEAVKHQPSPVAPPPSPAPVVIAPSPAPVVVPPSPARSDGRRAVFTKAAIATSVVGAALIVIGLGTGAGALGAREDYDRGCNRGMCADADYDKAHRLANATDFLLPVGVAAVVTSIVLFAVRPKAARRVAWSVSF